MTKGRPRKGALKEKVVQLDLHPPAGRTVRKTNQLVYLSRTIMNALIRHDESWPFLELLTPQKIDIPNYYDIVTHPMSFRVVKKRLANNYYWSADQAIFDLSMVFENAYRVTEPDSVMAQMARNVETLFHAHLQAMPQPEMNIDSDSEVARTVRPQIPYVPSHMDSYVDEQFVSSSDAVKNEPIDHYIEGNDNDGNDTMMEFALRRLERFVGVERLQAHFSWHCPSITFDDTCQSNVIDSNTNEDNIEDVVIQMRSELDNLEAEFHAYSDSYDRSIEFMRDILDGDGAESAPYDDEEVLVGTTRHYSYTQHNNVTQIILHDED